MIDLHCHLDLYSDPAAVISEVVKRNGYVLSVTTTPRAFSVTRGLVPAGSRIRTALGLHPELAVQRELELPLFEKLLDQTSYVGEIGLDGSRPHRATLDRQAAILMEIILMCAKAGGKTLTLHSREARALLLDILDAEPLAGKLILHWFSGTAKEISRASERGCWFSVSPTMLSSKSGLAAVSEMPIDRVLPETDGPFTKIGNVQAYPWDAMKVVPILADLWRLSSAETHERLISNFQTLSLAPSPT